MFFFTLDNQCIGVEDSVVARDAREGEKLVTLDVREH